MQPGVPTAMREPLCRPPASKIEKALGGRLGELAAPFIFAHKHMAFQKLKYI
jgi:hypothetical protein